MRRHLTLKDAAVLEAASRALKKASRGRKFDEQIFRCVAQDELQKLLARINKEG